MLSRFFTSDAVPTFEEIALSFTEYRRLDTIFEKCIAMEGA